MNIKNSSHIPCKAIKDVLIDLPHGMYCIFYYNSKHRFDMWQHNRMYIMTKPQMIDFLTDSIFETRIIVKREGSYIVIKTIGDPLYLRIKPVGRG